MDEKAVRLLIRKQLHSGRLPYDSASKVSGSPAAGEICAACGTVINEGQLVMEGVTRTNDGEPIELHLACFELWNDERQQPHTHTA